MTSPELQAVLLDDALYRVLINPTAVHGWRNLQRALGKTPQPAQVAQLRAALLDIPMSGVARFYRDGLFARLSSELADQARFSASLLQINPFDPDRASNHLQVMLQQRVLQSPNRLQLRDDIQTSLLPDIAWQLGAHIASLVPQASSNELAVEPLQRIAIVAPQLRDLAHPPSRMALDQAKVLQGQGYEVALFTAQESQGHDYQLLSGTGMSNEQTVPNLAGWHEYLGGSINIALPDPRFSLLRRCLNLLHSMRGFAPQLVYLVGNYSALAQTLYQRLPLMSMGSNSFAPLVAADSWLSAQPDAAMHGSVGWHAQMPIGQTCYYPFRLPRRAAVATLSRAELGVPDDALLLVSTLSPAYLKQLPVEWLAQLAAQLQRQPKAIWLLQGIADALPPAFAAIPPAQIRALPPSANVVGVLRCCDVYLGLPLMGGGFSVAEAMSEGLATLAYQGSDGGDKLGESAVVDDTGYFSTLALLLDQPEVRSRFGTLLRHRFDQQLDLAAAGATLQAHSLATLEQGRARLALLQAA